MTPLDDDHHQEEEHAEHHELGSNQPTEPDEHGSVPGHASPRRRPPREDEEAGAEPAQHQAVLEAARLEDPDRDQRERDECAERHEERFGVGAANKRSRARHRQAEPRGRQQDAETDRDPFQAHRRQDVADGEQRDPEWAGERLDALASVEHGSIAVRDLLDDAEVDEPVIDHPAIRPPGHGEQGDRHHEQAASQQPTRPVVRVSACPAEARCLRAPPSSCSSIKHSSTRDPTGPKENSTVTPAGMHRRDWAWHPVRHPGE